MTSPLATEDLMDLRAEGLVPSDEDIIRLHALALRITDGPETTAYNLPRFAVAGGVTFWEPTLAAWYFYEHAKTFAADTDAADWLFAFACAKGRVRGYLESLRDPGEIEKALGAFLGSIAATKTEVENAVYYAAVGQHVEPEETELAKANAKRANPGDRERAHYADLERTMAKAAAYTGLTYDDIMIQTKSRLQAMIYTAAVEAGREIKGHEAKAHADYLATLDAIRKRLIAEKQAKEAQDGKRT